MAGPISPHYILSTLPIGIIIRYPGKFVLHFWACWLPVVEHLTMLTAPGFETYHAHVVSWSNSYCNSLKRKFCLYISEKKNVCGHIRKCLQTFILKCSSRKPFDVRTTNISTHFYLYFMFTSMRNATFTPCLLLGSPGLNWCFSFAPDFRAQVSPSPDSLLYL